MSLDELRSLINAEIKKYRISNKELCEYAGCSRMTMHRFLTGEGGIATESLLNILAALNITIGKPQGVNGLQKGFGQ